MLIRCGKCGKMYDYDKCNGICPKCARYNRPDSREDMEQSLHDKYDAGDNPRQHDWYREPQSTADQEKRSYTYQSFGEQAARSGSKTGSASHQGQERKRSAFVPAIIILISVLAAVLIGIIVLFTTLGSALTDDWDVNGQGYDQAEETIDPEYQNRIYVDYAWADYLGEDLGDVDWDDYVNDYFTGATDGELRQLSQLSADPGMTYYIISLDVRNNLSDAYSLSYLTKDMISLWSDEDGDGNPDEYYPVEKLFTISHPETESMDDNYIEVLVAVPDDLEDLYGSCVLNDNTEEFGCYLDE